MRNLNILYYMFNTTEREYVDEDSAIIVIALCVGRSERMKGNSRRQVTENKMQCRVSASIRDNMVNWVLNETRAAAGN